MSIFKVLIISIITVSVFIGSVSAQPHSPQSDNQRTDSKSPTHSMVLSTDGRYLAVVQPQTGAGKVGMKFIPRDSGIQLWEIASGRLMWSKTSPANDAPRASFSPDGSKILLQGRYESLEGNVKGEGKNHVHLWETETGKSLVSPNIDEKSHLAELVFTPDGQQLVGKLSHFALPSAIKTWDITTGKLVPSASHSPELRGTANWEAKGKRLVTNSSSLHRGPHFKNRLHTWALPEFELLSALETGTERLKLRGISPDGNQVAFLMEATPPGKVEVPLWRSREIQLWDSRRKSYLSIPMPEGAIFHLDSLNFSTDGKTLVGSGSVWQGEEGNARLGVWNTDTGELKWTVEIDSPINRQEPFSYPVCLLPDNKSFVAVNHQGVVEQRSLEAGALIRTFEERKEQ